MDGLVELDPTGSGGFQLHVSLTKEGCLRKGGEIPHEMTNQCRGAIWQGFLEGSLLLHAPSKCFPCVRHIFSVLACKAGTSKISPEPPVFSKRKVRAPNKKKTTKCRNPYDGMWHYTRHIYLKIGEKGPEVWILRPDPTCNRQADFLHSLTKGLNARTSTGNIKCR